MSDRHSCRIPSSSVAIRLFGAFELQVDDGPVAHMRTRKEKWLLALLALAHGRAVERSVLAQTLWPFPETMESRAMLNLRRSLSQVRRALGDRASCLRSPTPRSVALDLSEVEIDVVTFDRAVARGDTASLHRAVSLYRGPLLSDCTETWALAERENRRQSYQKALQALSAHSMAVGDYAEAVRLLQQAVAVDPLWEQAQRNLMEALAGMGDYHAALQTYQNLVRLLHRDNPQDLPMRETTALYLQIRDRARRHALVPLQALAPDHAAAEVADFPAIVPAPIHVPRPLTELVGRDGDVASVAARLRSTRLVTLTGSGGIGKTRLAIAIAHEAAGEYPDGVCLIELASLTDADLVLPSVASALGVRDIGGQTVMAALLDHLRDRRVLLVLDNCEHLIAACAELVEGLQGRCPGLTILATSRQRLGLVGEAVWRVPSLPSPHPHTLAASAMDVYEMSAAYPAVKLFAERAEAVQSAFRLTTENARQVAYICHALDGIPLAIELAAARLNALPIDQIVARLDDRLLLLTGGSRTALPRQQTLRATLDWSCELLSDPERDLLFRLSVFVGGWTLEAAEAVCGIGDLRTPMLDTLAALVDRSLVIYDEIEGQARYRLLESLREYAAEKRNDREAEREGLHRRHAEFFLRIAEQAEVRLVAPDQALCLQHLDLDLGNLRMAMDWLVRQRDIGNAILLGSALERFWHMRGHFDEGRQRMEAILSLPECAHVPESACARAHMCAGGLAVTQADFPSASRHFERSLAIGRNTGDRWLIARATYRMGSVAGLRGDYTAAEVFWKQSLEISRAINDRGGMATSLNNLAKAASHKGDYARSRSLHEANLAIMRELGDRRSVAFALIDLANELKEEGDTVGARPLVEECLRIFTELQDRWGIAFVGWQTGSLALLEGDYVTARARLTECLDQFREIGDRAFISMSLAWMGRLDRCLGSYESAHAHLEEALKIARQIGATKNLIFCVEQLAFLGAAMGQMERAARLCGAAEALREATGAVPTPVDRAEREKMIGAVREALTAEALEAAWREGRTMTVDVAVTMAFGLK